MVGTRRQFEPRSRAARNCLTCSCSAAVKRLRGSGSSSSNPRAVFFGGRGGPPEGALSVFGFLSWFESLMLAVRGSELFYCTLTMAYPVAGLQFIFEAEEALGKGRCGKICALLARMIGRMGRMGPMGIMGRMRLMDYMDGMDAMERISLALVWADPMKHKKTKRLIFGRRPRRRLL